MTGAPLSYRKRPLALRSFGADAGRDSEIRLGHRETADNNTLHFPIGTGSVAMERQSDKAADKAYAGNASYKAIRNNNRFYRNKPIRLSIPCHDISSGIPNSFWSGQMVCAGQAQQSSINISRDHITLAATVKNPLAGSVASFEKLTQIVSEQPRRVPGHHEAHDDAALLELAAERRHLDPPDEANNAAGRHQHADTADKNTRDHDRFDQRHVAAAPVSILLNHSSSSCDCFDPVFCGYWGCSRRLNTSRAAA